jgi:integrase
MATKWQKSEEPGVRFREHKTRKHGIKKDRYFIISYRLNGKRKDESIGWASGGWTAKKAKAILTELQENQRKGSGPQTLKEKRELEQQRRDAENEKKALDEKNNCTFTDYFKNSYLPNAKENKKPESWCKEEQHFENWLKPEVGQIPIKSISPFNLEKIKKNMLNAGRKPRSIQYVFATFRQVWNHALLNDIVSIDSPTKKIKLPKVNNKRIRFLTHEEAELLLNELQKNSDQTYKMALLSLHTGMRAKELYSLTWGVVNFQNEFILVRDSKSGSRYVYLTEATKQILQNMYQGQPDSALIFKNRKGQAVAKISNTYFRVVEKLGFNKDVSDSRDKVIFHTLRHTFASWHVQNGTDLYELKELMGHSTIQLTERYAHLRPDGLKQTAQNFNKFTKNNNVANVVNIK